MTLQTPKELKPSHKLNVSNVSAVVHPTTGRLKKRSNVCLFNISGTNEQISKPFFSFEN